MSKKGNRIPTDKKYSPFEKFFDGKMIENCTKVGIFAAQFG